MASKDSKKRKRVSAVTKSVLLEVDTSKPTAVFKPAKGRSYTLSVALPGSIIANAQTHDLKTTLAGHIARALAVFCVDEVVIFDDGHVVPPRRNDYSQKQQLVAQDEENGYTAFSDPNHFLYHLLSYQEAPPYLRRSLFPYHPNLRSAGSLPSLDMPHHLRAEEWCQYREGVTVGAATHIEQTDAQGTGKNTKKNREGETSSSQKSTFVNVGFPEPITIPEAIPPNTRVTVHFPQGAASSGTPTGAMAVSPDTPREDAGYYWGYTPRLAPSLSAVFTESPFDGGYDYSVGTSERGVPLQQFLKQSAKPDATESEEEEGAGGLPKWQHLLIGFGGLAGLEKALKNDEALKGKVSEAKELFDAWINLVEEQGSRTIRTEEAIWIGLMGLSKVVLDREK